MRKHISEDADAIRYRVFDKHTGEMILYVRAFSTHQPGSLLVIRTDGDGKPIWPDPDSVWDAFVEEVQREFWVVDWEADLIQVVGMVPADHIVPFPARLIPQGDGRYRLDVAAAEAQMASKVAA